MSRNMPQRRYCQEGSESSHIMIIPPRNRRERRYTLETCWNQSGGGGGATTTYEKTPKHREASSYVPYAGSKAFYDQGVGQTSRTDDEDLSKKNPKKPPLPPAYVLEEWSMARAYVPQKGSKAFVEEHQGVVWPRRAMTSVPTVSGKEVKEATERKTQEPKKERRQQNATRKETRAPPAKERVAVTPPPDPLGPEIVEAVSHQEDIDTVETQLLGAGVDDKHEVEHLPPGGATEVALGRDVADEVLHETTTDVRRQDFNHPEKIVHTTTYRHNPYQPLTLIDVCVC